MQEVLFRFINWISYTILDEKQVKDRNTFKLILQLNYIFVTLHCNSSKTKFHGPQLQCGNKYECKNYTFLKNQGNRYAVLTICRKNSEKLIFVESLLHTKRTIYLS